MVRRWGEFDGKMAGQVDGGCFGGGIGVCGVLAKGADGEAGDGGGDDDARGGGERCVLAEERRKSVMSMLG